MKFRWMRKTQDKHWSLLAKVGWFTGPRDQGGCRDWTGPLNRGGYGYLFDGKATTVATRLILGLRKGDGLVAMHSCDRPSCVEPSHLRIGTHKENSDDKIKKWWLRNRGTIQKARLS